MHRRLEKAIEQDVVDWWEKKGPLYLQIKLNLHGRRGWPDRMFFPAGGRPVLIEFKQVGEKGRALQEHIHGQLRSLGYRVYVCDSVGDAAAILAST